MKTTTKENGINLDGIEYMEYSDRHNIFSPTANYDRINRENDAFRAAGCMVFYIENYDDENKLLEQNRAEYDLFSYGALIDNYTAWCTGGYLMLTEEYVTAWTSRHRFVFAPYDDPDAMRALEQHWAEYYDDDDDDNEF